MVDGGAAVGALIVLILSTDLTATGYLIRMMIGDGGVKERLKELEIETFGAAQSSGEGQSGQLDRMEDKLDNIETVAENIEQERRYMRKKLGDADDLSELNKDDLTWDERTGSWLDEYR
jgi:hypothetical protein